MKLLRGIGFLLGVTTLLVVINHFFNPNFEARPVLLISLILLLILIRGIEDYQEGRKKTGVFQIIIVGLGLILWISSLFMELP